MTSPVLESKREFSVERNSPRASSSDEFASIIGALAARTPSALAVAILAVWSLLVSTSPLPLRAQEGRDTSVQRPEPLESYMGREIAQTMHYSGAGWLMRDEREREERCSMVLANLGLKPGMTVCDLGCGNGFYSLPIAKLLGESGTVLAVDVQPEMLRLLRERIEESGINNVTPILGSFYDPYLPAKSVDLVLLVDVYHEFSYPEEMLSAIRRSLKEDGLVVLVEFREEDPRVPIKPEHKMSKAQVDKELRANGFELAKEFDKLPWQHMLFYGKAKEPEGDARRNGR